MEKAFNLLKYQSLIFLLINYLPRTTTLPALQIRLHVFLCKSPTTHQFPLRDHLPFHPGYISSFPYKNSNQYSNNLYSNNQLWQLLATFMFLAHKALSYFLSQTSKKETYWRILTLWDNHPELEFCQVELNTTETFANFLIWLQLLISKYLQSGLLLNIINMDISICTTDYKPFFPVYSRYIFQCLDGVKIERNLNFFKKFPIFLLSALVFVVGSSSSYLICVFIESFGHTHLAFIVK